MKFLFLGLVTILIAFPTLSLASDTREFDAAKVKKLEISNPKGEILVTISKNNLKKIFVTIEKIKFDKQCRFNISESSDTLSVKVDAENALFDKVNCVTKLRIEVPNSLFSFDASSGSASITFIDVLGTINFKTATGTVSIKGEVLKNIDGKTATGNVSLNFKKCLGRADIDLVSATGDAEVVLPTNCKIKVTHKSATGDLFNELGESEDYQVTIVSKSAGGSLKVKKQIN